MAEQGLKSFAVDAHHPVFAGHFPACPIVPGVMLLEWVLGEAARTLRRAPAELRVRETKFFTPLGPGQRATLQLNHVAPARCAFDVRRNDVTGVQVARGLLEWDADDAGA